MRIAVLTVVLTGRLFAQADAVIPTEASLQKPDDKIEVRVSPPRPDPEVVAGAKRRTFTAEYKLRILAEADAAAAQPGAIGALQRREGLYSSHLVTWRRERQTSILKGLTPHKRGPKSKRNPLEEEMQKLRRENQRLTEELRKAEIVIDVQKKVGALLGWPLPKADPQEKP
jgi:transposase-like protein